MKSTQPIHITIEDGVEYRKREWDVTLHSAGILQVDLKIPRQEFERWIQQYAQHKHTYPDAKTFDVRCHMDVKKR